MSARLHFRTRGGPTQGWGNIFRLAAFADHCLERDDYDVTFLVEGPEEVLAYLRGRGFAVVGLEDGLDLEAEAHALDAIPNSDVTIMEMLDCTRARQDLLKQHTSRLVVFDDLMDHTYSADIMICGQMLPEYGNMDLSSPKTKFLLGYDYFMFHPDFPDYHQQHRTHASHIRRVLAAFGGGSYANAYIKTAKVLAEMENVRGTFVLGYAETGLASHIREILPTAEILGGVENMAQLMASCDLAVVSAGYLKLEAAITRTPAIMIATQWHQIPLAEMFHKRTGTPYAGYMSHVTLERLNSLVKGLSAPQVRDKAAVRAAKVVDGKGMERVYDAIFA